MRCFTLRLTTVLVCLAVTLLGHTTPGSAEDVSEPPGFVATSATPTVPPITWTQARFENVREGYQALSWEPVPPPANGAFSFEGANEVVYEVADLSGNVFYRGGLPEAFISGLPDGEHAFEVRALTETPAGEESMIAASRTPAVVSVNHWPMSQAWALLGVGAIIFGVLIGLIVIGDRTVRAESVS